MTLSEALIKKGLKKNVVAKALNINPNNIKRYEDLEKRSVEELRIIASAIGENLSFLIGEKLSIDTSSESELKQLLLQQNELIKEKDRQIDRLLTLLEKK